MSKIKVIDSIMGSGKTSWSIQEMNNNPEQKYIYITPYLSEIERMKKSCPDKKFTEPVNLGKGKLDSLHFLLTKGRNICSTHALFRTANEVTKTLLQSNEYILILDEVMDVVEKLDLKKDDIQTILSEKLAHIENDFLIWDKEDYNGRYNDIKLMANNKAIVIINNTALFWNFPVDIFESFKEVYIMTYIFDAQVQKYYYDFHNVEYDYYSVVLNDNRYTLIEHSIDNDYDIRKSLQDKIDIIQNDKINNIGNNKYALSSSWFKKESNQPLWDLLKNNTYNFFNNKNKCKAKDRMWSTFQHAKQHIQGKGYSNGFTSINLRATNDYADRYILAYCCNIFLHPDIEHFFRNRNIKVDDNLYALSEMLQWIWRSRIRKDENIIIYIPSQRMRNLLIMWLNCEI